MLARADSYLAGDVRLPSAGDVEWNRPGHIGFAGDRSAGRERVGEVLHRVERSYAPTGRLDYKVGGF